MTRRQLFYYEFPEDGGGAIGAPVPGADEGDLPVEPTTAAPPAEAPNTDQQQRDLGPIPYSRFKEVNDRRRILEEQIQPYVDLEAAGYGVEDLHRLAAWEREFQQDPTSVWLRQAVDLDLPEAVKAAITAHIGAEPPKGNPAADAGPPSPKDQTPGQETGSSAEDAPPDWAKPLLEDLHARRDTQAKEALQGTLDAIISTWEQLDKDQDVAPASQALMLRYIQTSEGDDPATILQSAREAWLADREAMLKSEIKLPGREAIPRPVPGSGAGSSAPPIKPSSLREATKLADAALKAGQLG